MAVTSLSSCCLVSSKLATLPLAVEAACSASSLSRRNSSTVSWSFSTARRHSCVPLHHHPLTPSPTSTITHPPSRDDSCMSCRQQLQIIVCIMLSMLASRPYRPMREMRQVSKRDQSKSGDHMPTSAKLGRKGQLYKAKFQP